MDHSQSSSSPLSMAQNEATRDGSSLPSLSPPLPRMRRGCRRHNIRTNAKLVTTTAATLAVIISWFGSGNSAVANAQQKLQLQLQHQHLQQQIASTSSTNLRGLLPEWIEGGDEEDDSDSENIQANRELGTSANKKKKKDNQDADDNIIAKKEKIEIENELRKEVNQMLRNKKDKQKDKQQEKDKKQNGEEEEEEEEEQQKDKKNKKNKKEQTQQQSSKHTQDKKKDKKEQIQMQSSQQTHDKKKDKKDKENNADKEKEQQKPKKDTKEEIKKKKEKQKNKQDGDDNDKPKKPNQQTATLPTESKNQNDGKKDDDKKPSKKDESKNDDDNNNKPSKKDEPANKPSKKDDVTSSGTSVTTTTTSTGAAIAGSAGQLGTTTTTTTTTTTSTTAVGAGSAGQPGTTTTTTSTGAAVVVSSAGPWKFVNALSDPSIPLDSFEASTSGKLQWTSSSSNPWTSSQVASDGTSSMASGITSAISGSLQPVYSNLTLATDSNFEGGVLTFRLLAKSLVFPRESFFVMVDETVELLPEDVVTTNGNWMEYSVPVGKGAHKVTWVHVYNLFGLKVLSSVGGGGEVGLWMDDLRLAPFASLKYVDQLTLEMINGGGSASWEATGNSIVASSSNIQGSEGSANIQFALYSSKGAKLTYRIQTSTSGPHDDFTILFNNNTAIASTMFGDMIGYESRSLTIPKGKVVVTLSHRKNPGQLDSTVLQSLGAVGTEGKTWLEGLSLNLIA